MVVTYSAHWLHDASDPVFFVDPSNLTHKKLVQYLARRQWTPSASAPWLETVMIAEGRREIIVVSTDLVVTHLIEDLCCLLQHASGITSATYLDSIFRGAVVAGSIVNLVPLWPLALYGLLLSLKRRHSRWVVFNRHRCDAVGPPRISLMLLQSVNSAERYPDIEQLAIGIEVPVQRRPSVHSAASIFGAPRRPWFSHRNSFPCQVSGSVSHSAFAHASIVGSLLIASISGAWGMFV